MNGTSVETIRRLRVFRNNQLLVSYSTGGTHLESGLAPGTYTYHAEAEAIRIYQGEERVRMLYTAPFTVTVNPPPPLYNEAEFVSHSLPGGYLRLFTGQTMPMSVQMRNTGTTTWSSANAYSLGSKSPQDNWNWGMGRVALPHDVAPGQTVTFNFTLTAPTVAGPGNIDVQWQMVQDGVQWFGQTTSKASIDVRPMPVGSISAQPNPCELLRGATTCGTTLTWSANTTNANTQLWRSDLNGNGATRIMTSESGTLSFADISAAGSRFQVIGYDQVIASIDVVGRPPPQVVTGNVDGLTADGAALLGWACATTRDSPIDVHLYVGGPAGADGATFVGAYTANQASEAQIATACKAGGANYRFAIPISAELRSLHEGRLIYVHGISPTGSGNLAISSSGRYRVPSPLVSTPRPHARRYVYDQHQQLCKIVEPETGATVMGYDGAGNLAWSAAGVSLPAIDRCDLGEATASGRVVNRTYDARNRLKTLSFPDGRGNQAWEYTPDGLPSKITTYNDPGNVAPVENTYSYNKRRLIIGESVAQPGWYQWDVGYGYDRHGHLASHVYPDRLAVTYEPNALGQPTRVSSVGGVYASEVSYYPNGGIQRFVYGNGVTHTMTQNVRQLPQRSADAGIIDFENVYDGNGNVAAIYDRIRGDHYSRGMEYDGLDRLKAAGSCSFGGDCWHRFTYDAQDNLQSWRLPGVKDYAAYLYDEHSHLTNIRNSDNQTIVGLGYDEQGNLRNKNGQAYVFDYGNRLREATGKERYRYDGQGRRVLSAPVDSSPHSLFQYTQSGQLFYEEDGNKNLAINNIYLQGSLLATREIQRLDGGQSIRYQHTDGLGSPVAVSNESGQVIERAEYEPYGAVVGDPNYSGIGYAGHVMDGQTGLLQMQQRYYDPSLGMFLSTDPVSVDKSTAWNFCRYCYAANNPYKFTDPDGRGAALTLVKAGFAVDAAIPEPTDAAIPKWVGWGIVFVGAVAIDYVVSSESSESSASNDDSASEASPKSSGSSGGRTPAPFLPDDPYSPEETSRRQTGNREAEGAPSLDPDSPIPDRGPGSDQGGHEVRGRTPHESGERNVNSNEEHSRRPKGNPIGRARR